MNFSKTDEASEVRKIARLKKLIENVAGLSMEGQQEVITKFYDEWKGEHEQVDDILLIGIRV